MMRGTDETSGSLFGYFDLEGRIQVRHPLRKIRQRSACQRGCRVCGALYRFWSSFDPAGAADPGQPAPDPVLGPL